MKSRLPIIRIANGTFYRQHPGLQTRHANPPLFSNLSFELLWSSPEPRNWYVIGPSFSGKTTLLHILGGRLLCDPPTARSFPYLSEDGVPRRLQSPPRAVRYVGFDAGWDTAGLGAGAGVAAAYLAARYESRREVTDFSLRDFLLGNTELNPLRTPLDANEAAVSPPLLDLPVTFLSNGQGRRARITRALLTRPEVLLLDEPFMGLDPPTVSALSPLLQSLAAQGSPRLVLSARTQDPLLEWITHLVFLRTDCQVGSMGPKEAVLDGLKSYVQGVKKGGLAEDKKLPVHSLSDVGRVLSPLQPLSSSKTDTAAQATTQGSACVNADAEPLVEMDGCQVRYGDKIALGNWSQQTPQSTKDGLVWTVRRGERWGVFGPNGSGKMMIVSLLGSDHPQTYSLPIRLFGRSRLPEPGSGVRPLKIWTSRRASATPAPRSTSTCFAATPSARSSRTHGCPRSAPSPNSTPPRRPRSTRPCDGSPLSCGATRRRRPTTASAGPTSLFGDMSFSAQRVALFVRAVKSPDVVVLDEAFSGMDKAVRDKCMRFLTHGEGKAFAGLTDRQALICIAHVRDEVPDCVRECICLPEANTRCPARFGRLGGALRDGEARWQGIWAFAAG